jgi:hypothetical protein
MKSVSLMTQAEFNAYKAEQIAKLMEWAASKGLTTR